MNITIDKSLPLTITPEATKAIKDIMHAKAVGAKHGLRIGVQGSGCSASQSFLLGFDTPTANDKAYSHEGFNVFIDKAHLMYIMGLELNYEVDEEGHYGFAFNNPDAS